MAVTAKSLREKVDQVARSEDGQYDPKARVSLPVADVLFLANQLDALGGNELTPSVEARFQREGRRELEKQIKANLTELRCSIAKQIAKGDVQNLRAAFVANALLDVAEEIWYPVHGDIYRTQKMIDATKEMLSSMDRLQVMAQWQLVPQLPSDAGQLARPVSSLEISKRAMNTLQAEQILTVGDLVQRTESELGRIPNLGSKSKNEILEALKIIGFSLAR